MRDPTSSGDTSGAPSPPPTLARTTARLIGGLLLLVLGALIVVAGVAGIFLLHTPGIGRALGCMIVLGAALAVGGWTTLKGEQQSEPQ